MMRAFVETGARLLGFAALAIIAGAAVGCAPQTQQLQTAHYSLSHPDFWKVKKQAAKDGDATVVIIPQYGSAVIDTGSGSVGGPGGQNYDAVTADVEVRLFSWPDQPGNPTEQVVNLLGDDPELLLTKHGIVPDNPPECGVYAKKYTVFGTVQTPLDLWKRPGWRTVVVGGRANGYLLGAVARFEYEPDAQRNCHNLGNLRVQLQNLLDGLTATSGGAKPAGAATPVAEGTPPKP